MEIAELRHHARVAAAAELFVRRAVDDVMKRIVVASNGGRSNKKRKDKKDDERATKEELADITSALALRARNSIEISRERLQRSRSQVCHSFLPNICVLILGSSPR
jgi:hypothetical protein